MLLIALTLAASAQGVLSGVGLGPLHKSGITDGTVKAFYLTVSNPARRAQTFRVGVTPPDDLFERAKFDPNRFLVFPAEPVIGGERGHRVLVIVRDLKAGETIDFRICAEEKTDGTPIIHPRVCSKLSARRVTLNR